MVNYHFIFLLLYSLYRRVPVFFTLLIVGGSSLKNFSLVIRLEKGHFSQFSSTWSSVSFSFSHHLHKRPFFRFRYSKFFLHGNNLHLPSKKYLMPSLVTLLAYSALNLISLSHHQHKRPFFWLRYSKFFLHGKSLHLPSKKNLIPSLVTLLT